MNRKNQLAVDRFHARCRELAVNCVVQVGVGRGGELAAMLPAIGYPRLIGFEPSPTFKKFWDAKGYPGEYLVAAVCERDGKARFYPVSDAPMKRAEAGTLYKSGDEPGWVDVSTTTLDTFMRGMPDLANYKILLWMDCEGAELDALKCASSFLRSCVAVECEFHDRQHEPGRLPAPPRSQVSRLLESAGLRYAFKLCRAEAAFFREA